MRHGDAMRIQAPKRYLTPIENKKAHLRSKFLTSAHRRIYASLVISTLVSKPLRVGMHVTKCGRPPGAPGNAWVLHPSIPSPPTPSRPFSPLRARDALRTLSPPAAAAYTTWIPPGHSLGREGHVAKAWSRADRSSFCGVGLRGNCLQIARVADA